MSESTKTLTFLGLAVVAAVVAVATRPSTADFDAQTLVDRQFSTFDPERAKRLQIVRFDEDTATLREFEVAEQDGVWSIPSKGGYPADAQQQMGRAVAGILDREIIAVVSENAGDHAQYGVVDPKSPKLEVGQTGVGTRVTLSDIDNKPLVDMIIGKPVKDSTSQYYVRKPTQDVVYQIEVSPDDFSTKFEDWIEEDLLKLSAFDIQQVMLHDYSASAQLVMTQQGIQPQLDWDRREKMTLVHDDSENKWKPQSLLTYNEQQDEYVPFELQENETLNEDVLRELRNALDDLRVVDVDRKPTGLSANLKAGEDFLRDTESVQALMRRGFIPASVGTGEVEILSNEGEVVVTMKDGVEYVLRFGDLQLSDEEEQVVNVAAAGETPGAEAPDDGVNRYLFAMARFNEAAIEKPDLEELPELPEGASELADSGSADSGATENGSAGDDASEEPTDEQNGDQEQEDAGDGTSSDQQEEASDGGESDREESTQEILERRKEITTANQRKEDEYNEKIKQGQERVKELNERFGDWFYVISNDVYKKIHLSREDVIKQKEPESETDGTGEASDASALGAPGSAIPGLPNLPPGIREQPAPDSADGASAEGAPADEAPADGTSAGEVPTENATPDAETPDAQPASDESETEQSSSEGGPDSADVREVTEADQ